MFSQALAALPGATMAAQLQRLRRKLERWYCELGPRAWERVAYVANLHLPGSAHDAGGEESDSGRGEEEAA